MAGAVRRRRDGRGASGARDALGRARPSAGAAGGAGRGLGMVERLRAPRGERRRAGHRSTRAREIGRFRRFPGNTGGLHRGLADATKGRDDRPADRRARLDRTDRAADWPNTRAAEARAEDAGFVHLVNCHRNSKGVFDRRLGARQQEAD